MNAPQNNKLNFFSGNESRNRSRKIRIFICQSGKKQNLDFSIHIFCDCLNYFKITDVCRGCDAQGAQL